MGWNGEPLTCIFRSRFLRLTYLPWAVLFTFATALAQSPVKIIFDTDMGSDCDDAGAMAVLHALADLGEVEILASIYSSRGDVGDNQYGPGVLDAIQTFYGRPDIPIGANRGGDVGDPNICYLKQIGNHPEIYGHDVMKTSDVPDMVDLYRKTLANNEDNSVVILTVGHPIALVHLLRSEADSYSDLNGTDLVRKKVSRWVAVGDAPSEPKIGWNFSRNGMSDYASQLLKDWPTDFYLSEKGRNVMTGAKLRITSKTNPVREAYRIWLTNWAKGKPNRDKKNRFSLDAIGVLFAVRGTKGPFSIISKGSFQRTSEGTSWDPSKDNPRDFSVNMTISDKKMAHVIEALMIAPPAMKMRQSLIQHP